MTRTTTAFRREHCVYYYHFSPIAFLGESTTKRRPVKSANEVGKWEEIRPRVDWMDLGKGSVGLGIRHCCLDFDVSN